MFFAVCRRDTTSHSRLLLISSTSKRLSSDAPHLVRRVTRHPRRVMQKHASRVYVFLRRGSSAFSPPPTRQSCFILLSGMTLRRRLSPSPMRAAVGANLGLTVVVKQQRVKTLAKLGRVEIESKPRHSESKIETRAKQKKNIILY